MVNRKFYCTHGPLRLMALAWPNLHGPANSMGWQPMPEIGEVPWHWAVAARPLRLAGGEGGGGRRTRGTKARW
jgi:hypothetical protein